METKQEFLDGLRRSLTGKIGLQEIEEHIRYYDDYITAQSRIKGGEQAVLEELGSPRLIAMSICAAAGAGDGTAESPSGTSENRYTGAGRTDNSGYGEEKQEKDDRPFIFRHPKITIAVIVVVAVLLLIFFAWLAFSLLSFFWPVIVAGVLIVLLVRLIAYINSR